MELINEKTWHKGDEMNEMRIRGSTYKVLPNGDHYTVVDDKGFAMISVANKEDAKETMINMVNHCEELYRRNL